MPFRDQVENDSSIFTASFHALVPVRNEMLRKEVAQDPASFSDELKKSINDYLQLKKKSLFENSQ